MMTTNDDEGPVLATYSDGELAQLVGAMRAEAEGLLTVAVNRKAGTLAFSGRTGLHELNLSTTTELRAWEHFHSFLKRNR